MRARLLAAAAIAVVACGGASIAAAGPAGRGGDRARSTAIGSPVELANACVAIASAADGRFVGTAPGGYSANRHTRDGASPFYLKPTRLGAYMLSDRGRMLATARVHGAVVRDSRPRRAAEWTLLPARRRSFAIRSTLARRRLGIAANGRLVLAARGSRAAAAGFVVHRDRGCRPYAEARVGASGPNFEGRRPNGTVFGFVDAHLHITADMRAGGRVISGEPFDRFGITRALGHDARDHGPRGGRDFTGNLLRTASPIGTHDVHGWPTFAGWPVHDTYTHQQTYYVWLKRVWKAGLRVVVAQTVEDQPICRIEPVRAHPCDETQTVKLEIRRLHALQDYVDAQSGGPGRGWFRLVYSPAQARRVIERGKLAVLIGIESSDLFGCSEFEGRSRCTRRDVDRGIRTYRRLGVRTMFVAHWVDNAFAGAALEGGATGLFINILQALETGRYFRVGACPDPSQGVEVAVLPRSVLEGLAKFFPAARRVLDIPVPTYPAERRCNVRGLSPLGRYLIRRLIANHMLIEVDHLSERARETVLRMAAARHYPLVSSHTGTGGAWTPSELRRLYANGGFATATPDQAPALAQKIVGMRAYRSPKHYFGVGLGTDTGGFSALPGPRPDAATNPLRYPFRSYDGRVRFVRERTGERTFDLNADGVAHYGLFADLLADMQRQPRGRAAMRLLFRSAEAYLETWRRAVRHR